MGHTVFYGTVIDGTGGDPIPKGMVVVEQDKLRYVGPRMESYPLPQDAQVVDAGDGVVMPGLIESHSHLAGYGSGNTLDWVITPRAILVCQAVADLAALLEAGFTSVRDVGGMGPDLRRAMERGLIKGPRIATANAAVSPTSGHADVWTDFDADFLHAGDTTHRMADGVEECRKAAREQFRKGADFLKIMTTGGIMDTASNPDLAYYSHEEIAVFVEEATRMGTYVTTHAESNAGVYNAVKAGVTCIEHGYMTSDETLELMVKKGCFQVPTLSAMTNLLKNAPTMQPHVREKIQRVVPLTYESVSRARAAGVPMATGADFLSIRGMGEYGENAQELVELVNVGFSPMEAICACTKNGAILMGMEDEIGTLQEGKRADLIVVDGDPLKDITLLTETGNIKLVMKDGVVHKNTLR